MSQDWEATFKIWGQPPSQTQQDKAENAVRAVRKAIDASPRYQQNRLTSLSRAHMPIARMSGRTAMSTFVSVTPEPGLRTTR